MEGYLVLGIYFIFMMGAVLIMGKNKTSTLKGFLVGDRQEGMVRSGLSIAATWIWAPAIFVSAEKAYTNGWPGLFWFLVPNILCLLFFIPFAKKIREQLPEGITLSGYMKDRYCSDNVKNVYVVQLMLLSILSTAVQLLAGGKILSLIMGIPFWIITVILALIALSYSWRDGLKASVLTDAVQMIMILGTCLVLVPWALTNPNAGNALQKGLSGITGEYSSLFNSKGLALFFSFGLPTAIGLIAGPFGDQCFWQRAFSIKENKIGGAFALGAIFFALVPLSMGLFGFLASGYGYIAADKGLVNFELISQMFPGWVTVPFLFMIVSGLLSTVDSNMCATSSLTTDMGYTDLTKARISMAVLLLLGIVIANIPGLTVTHLFLIYGTLRATTLMPTIMTLLGKTLNPRGIYYGVLGSMIIGLPIFAFGTILNISAYKTIGCLLALLISGITAVTYRKCT